jgi:hypothetical protein
MRSNPNLTAGNSYSRPVNLLQSLFQTMQNNAQNIPVGVDAEVSIGSLFQTMQNNAQNWEESTGFSFPPASIVGQIYTLLKERYKEGFPIIKEIIQNANDGGATRLDIGITQGLKDATHPLLKASGLFFVNNGSFCDSDAQAIGWFGADLNVGNTAKIGKFGLGQKSIFHFCEAFFYVAHSHHLSGTPERGRFLNPWANSTNPVLPDDKHPDWKQLTPTTEIALLSICGKRSYWATSFSFYGYRFAQMQSVIVISYLTTTTTNLFKRICLIIWATKSQR